MRILYRSYKHCDYGDENIHIHKYTLTQALSLQISRVYRKCLMSGDNLACSIILEKILPLPLYDILVIVHKNEKNERSTDSSGALIPPYHSTVQRFSLGMTGSNVMRYWVQPTNNNEAGSRSYIYIVCSSVAGHIPDHTSWEPGNPYWHGLTLIPVCISNCIHYRNYFNIPKLQRRSDWSWEWISNFTRTLLENYASTNCVMSGSGIKLR